ncbi:MAG: hypothetical protein GY904_30565 [Planctomycetaceae bacterium]|nr:hypothetical protein [Planctomycetaceae bacterium]
MCDQDEWKKQQKEAKQREQLSDLQREVLTAVNDLEGEWLTRRQVCEALDIEWTNRGRNKECKRVERALRTLASEEEIQTVSSGSENTYSSRDTPYKASSAGPPSHTKGFDECRHVSSRVVSVVTSPPAPAVDTGDDIHQDRTVSPKPLASLGGPTDTGDDGGFRCTAKKTQKRSALSSPPEAPKPETEPNDGVIVVDFIPPLAAQLPFDLEDGDEIS